MEGVDAAALIRDAARADPAPVAIALSNKPTDPNVEGAFDRIDRPIVIAAVDTVLTRAAEVCALRRDTIALRYSLADAAAKLQLTTQELDALTYSLSHDLRAPLRAIASYIQIIEEDLGDRLGDLERRLFDVVRDNSRKMSGLIEDLLAFSRAARHPIDAGNINMAALAEEAWCEASDGAPATDRRLRVESLPVAYGDRAMLKQVWLRLLSNAVKFTRKTDDPSIIVSGETVDGEFVYCVRDNGAGFNMRNYDRLFTIFQRLHSERDYSGNGVGLAIVRRIVARHGGRVWAQSEPNSGASFFFSLPAAPG